MKVKEKDELKRVEDNVVTKFIREEVESYISDDSDVDDNVDVEQDKITGFRQNIFELIIWHTITLLLVQSLQKQCSYQQKLISGGVVLQKKLEKTRQKRI